MGYALVEIPRKAIMERCPSCLSHLPSSAANCPTCGVWINQNLAAGTLLQSKYLIEEQLGQGGFGITYRATAVLPKMSVAIKEYFPQGAIRASGRVSLDPEAKQELRILTLEAQAIARFSHPGIVRIIDVFEENGTAYVVMEFLQGMTLEERIAHGPRLSPDQVKGIALEAAAALSVVHQQNLLHRDLKPANIFLSKDRVVLIDFGTAREFIHGKTVGHTRVLNPGYAPLEQYAPESKLGPYTDIYALGATLYHALTGHPPPDAVSRTHGQVPLELPPSTPDALAKAIRSALELRAPNRPQSVSEWTPLLNGVPKPQPPAFPASTTVSSIAPTPQPAPTPLPYPSGRSTARPPAPLTVVIFVWGAVAVAFGWLAFNFFMGWDFLPALARYESYSNGAVQPEGGVQIVSSRFDGCVSEQGTSLALVAGVASKCGVQVRFTGGGDLAQARFTYRLQYTQDGIPENLTVPGEDTWSPEGGNTALQEQSGVWNFIVPLSVRKRPDRSYHTIVALGKLTLTNGDVLRFEQTIPILHLPNTQQLPSYSSPSGAPTPTFGSWYLDRCENDSVVSSLVVAGEALTCYLVIEYHSPSSISLSRADFSFSFESINASGQVTTLNLSGTDSWTPGGGTASLKDDGERLIFGVPIAVKYRENAPFQTLVVMGTLKFSNGHSKRVVEKIGIEYPMR